MIIFQSHKGDVRLLLDGNIPELTADVCMLISSIYERLMEESKPSAKAFKESVQFLVADGTAFEPDTEGDDTKLDPELQSILDKINKEINNNGK